MLIIFPKTGWLDDLKATYTTDPQVQDLITLFLEDKLGNDYSIRADLLLYKNQLYIPQDRKFKRRLLELAHNGLGGGHFGYDKTV